jgi:hypothetical protein
MWQDVEACVGKSAHRVRIGTRSGTGAGFISFSAAVLEPFGSGPRCDIQFASSARKVRLHFRREGKFKIAVMKKGGGRVQIAPADWLPPVQFRALPVVIAEQTGDYLILQLPPQWPEPPVVAEAAE